MEIDIGVPKYHIKTKIDVRIPLHVNSSTNATSTGDKQSEVTKRA